MTFNIYDYKYGHKIVSLALDEDTFQKLNDDNLETIYISDGKVKLYPLDAYLNFSIEDINMLLEFNNYDVFEIDETGNVNICHKYNMSDNALFLTPKCNSNCIMCPMSEKQRKLEANKYDTIIQTIYHLPKDTKHLTITGGEPFLIGENIFKILELLKDRLNSTKFLLLTNGRALASKIYFNEFIRTTPKNITIAIPIHGSTASLHDKITQSEGSFMQTFLGLKNLLNYDFKVEIRIVVSKLNIYDVNNIADLIIKEFPKVYSIKIIGLEMLGNAHKNKDSVWISYNMAFKYVKPIIKKIMENGIDIALYNFPLCSVEKEFHTICMKSITDYKITYFDVCYECKLFDFCGGVFKGTGKMAYKDIKPWG